MSLSRPVAGFVGGVLATLIFHQAALGLLTLAGVVPRVPWSMTPVPPFGVPAVISLAFWGGIWGIVLIACLDRWTIRRQWLFALVFGALLPTLVAWLVVAPLKGRPLPASPQALAVGLYVNGVWGIATWLIARMIGRRRGAAALADRAG